MPKLTRSVLGVAMLLAGCVAPSETARRPAPAATPAPVATSALSSAAANAPNPMVGGATMDRTRTLAGNVAAAPNLATLEAAVAAAGLEATLAGPGPYTLFAPNEDAFARLQPGALDALLRPENRERLASVLRFHLLSGALSAADLRARVVAGGGQAQLATVAGQPLTARLEDGIVTLTDANGVKSYVETADVRQVNGVMHVINGVLAPKLP